MVKQNHITHVAANKSALNASAPRHRPSAARRAAVWTTLIAFVGQSLVVSAQQVVADPHAAPGQKPRIDSAANGVPLVQIAAPSAAGVSHNQYQDFNIDQRGLILNNARTVTATQQGGYVEGNANLANGSARIILNEVTSSNASRLGGYAEVAGQRAEVVIANPNGITCNGCGFINTSRGVLTTGTPVFGGSGSLDGFRVTQGLINIEGAGLNGANLDQLDLLTRALQLNADIWANNLNVVTGSNQVNYTTLDAQPITGAGGKPAVSLDVAALGGMYANKIRLIGTESGVGVVSKGTIAAKAGDLVVTQTGKVSFAGVTSATGNVTVTGNDSVDNQGTLYSQANVAIDSQGEVRNSGTLAAQVNTQINAVTVVSSGTLAAGTNRDGTLATTGNLNIDAKQSLSATGQNVAGGNIRFDAAAIALTGATTRGNAIDLNARAGDIDHSGGTLAAADRVAINASGNFINNGATAKAQGAVTMTVGGSTQNTGGTLEAAQALNLTTGSLNNDQGRIVSLSGDGLGIAATGAVTNRAGTIGGNGSVAISGQSLDATGGKISAKQNLSLTADRDVVVDDATLQSGGDLSLTSQGNLSNQRGALTAGQMLRIDVATLNNQAGRIVQQGSGDTRIAVVGALDNRAGSIASNGINVSINAATLNNSDGKIEHAGNGTLTLSTGAALQNVRGVIGANGAIKVTVGDLDNSSGKLTSAAPIALHSLGTLNNSQGVIAGSDAVALAVDGALSNNGGTIESAKRLDVTAQNLTGNDQGRIVSLNAAGLSLTTMGAANAQGGMIGANGTVDVHAGTLDVSRGTIYAGDNLTVTTTAGDLVADNAQVTSGKDLTAKLQGTFSNRGGVVDAAQVATINVGSLDNRSGRLQAGQLTLDAGSLLNQSGSITQDGALDTTFTVTGATDNTDGTIASNGAKLKLTTGTLTNDRGSIAHAGHDRLTVAVGATLSNVAGKIESNGLAAIDAKDLDNASGLISTEGLLGITTTAGLNNNGGTLTSRNAVNIAATGFAGNVNGVIEANGGLTLNAANLDNHNGRIANISGDGLTVVATGALDNRNGEIAGNGDTTVRAAGIDNGTGALSAQGNLVANAGNGADLNNTGGMLSAKNGTVSATARNLFNGNGTVVAEHNDATLTLSGVLDNNNGVAYAGRDLSISGATGVSNINTASFGKGLLAGRDLTLTGVTLDNNNGQLSAGNDLTLDLATVSTMGLAEAQNHLNLSLSGDYVHNGILRAPNLLLSARNVYNDGILAARDSLTVRALDSIVNGSGKVMFSAGNLSLYANNVGNQVDAAIYALGNIDIALNENGGAANLVLNDRGLVEAHGGNLVIAANSIQNVGLTPQLTQITFSDSTRNLGAKTSCFTGVANDYCRDDNSTWWMRDNGHRPISDADLEAFANKYPIIRTLPNYYLGGTWTTPGNDGGHESEETWRYYYADGYVQQVAPSFVARPGRMLAGGDVALNGNNIENRNSTISAGANVLLSGGNLVNQGQDLIQHIDLRYEHWKHDKGHQPNYDMSYVDERVVGSVPALISAGGTIQGNLSGSLINGREEGRIPTLSSNPGTYQAPSATGNAVAGGAQTTTTPTSGPAGVTGTQSGNGVSGSTGAPGVAAFTLPTPAPTLTGSVTGVVIDPNGQLDLAHFQPPAGGLFVTNNGPGQRYLVETNPAFAQYTNFISSDYMLNRLGIDPAQAQRRLGDGFYEQQLLRDRLLAVTGKQFTGSYADWDAQYRALLDSGATFATDFNLRPGVKLSAAQVATLTSNIVWLEEQEVTTPSGRQLVLVPQLYLAPGTPLLSRTDGALMLATDIDLNVGRLVNSGRIQGTNRVIASTKGDLQNLGGTIAGGQVGLVADGQLVSRSGRITGSNVSLYGEQGISLTTSVQRQQVSGGHLDLIGSQSEVNASEGLVITSGRDLLLAGAKLNGGKYISLAALDGDVRIASIVQDEQRKGGGQGREVRWSGESASTRRYGSQVESGGDLSIDAKRDVTLLGSNLKAGGLVSLGAGRDIVIGTVEERRYIDAQEQGSSKGLFSNKTVNSHDTVVSTTAIGSSVSGQNLLLKADHDVTIQGSTINADQALVINAGRDVNITAAQDTHGETHDRQEQHSASGFARGLATVIGSADPAAVLIPNSPNQVVIAALLTKEAKAGDQAASSSTAVGSQLTGGSIDVQSGRDTLVQGSAIVADGNVSLAAQRDLTITTAQNTQSGNASSDEKTTGLLRFDATGNSVGKRAQDQAEQTTGVTHTASQIVSLGKGGEAGNEGNVTLTAIGTTTLTGSTVMAPGGDITLGGANVVINAVHNTTTQASQTHFNETAATLQLKSGYVDAAKGVYNSIQTAREAKQDTGSDRMAGLAALNAAASAYNAYQGVAGSATSASANAAPISAISVSSSVGVSNSESNSSSSQSTAQGSQVLAGGTLSIDAHGDQASGNGNLTLIGANLSAGQAANLTATGDIHLLAAENRVKIDSSNQSSNASAGVTFALGGQQNGFSFQLGAQGSRGQVNGEETSYTNTQIKAGSATQPGSLVIQSGGDTTLKGANASADRIRTEVGGNLWIESLKDQIRYDSEQTSSGAGVSICIPPICYGTFVTVNVNASEAKIKADHDSVGANNEAAQAGQSGLKAGNGGFEVKVNGDTTLIGGVISSTQAAIDNQANRFSTGGSLTTQDIHNHSELNAHSFSINVSVSSGGTSASGAHIDGKTGGAFGYGEASKEQSSTTKAGISGIAGDQSIRTGDTQAGIKPVFTTTDADKVNQSLAVQTGITAEFGKNAAKAVGDFAGSQVKDLKAQAEQAQANGNEAEYQRLTLEASKWDEGGIYRVGLHTIAGAMGGGVNGALGAAASAEAAPLLNQMQDKVVRSLIDSGMNPATAQATAGLLTLGVAASIGGAAGGVQGATTAGNIDLNNRQLHPDERALISRLAKDQARQLCGGDAQCVSTATITWTDALERAAENLDDDKKSAENTRYLDTLLQTTNNPNSEGAIGGVQNYLATLQRAQAVLAPYRGKPIIVNGVNTGQTYFSATPEQRANPTINYILGIDPPAPIVSGKTMRDEDRLERFAATNGALAPNTIDLDIATLGVGAVGRVVARAAARTEAEAAAKAARIEQNALLDLGAPNYARGLEFKPGTNLTAEEANALNVSKATANVNDLKVPTPEYMRGTIVKDKMLQPGDKLYVIESQNQANPGSFAASKQYSSLDQARRELALLPEWKDATQSVGLVVREYTVIKPTPIREGITGAQTSQVGVTKGVTYNGGGVQFQFMNGVNQGGVWQQYLSPPKTYSIK